MKMHPLKIYIAGPMRGVPGFNYPAFNNWERSLRRMGFLVENPAKIGKAFGTPEQMNENPALLKMVMDADIRALAKCDAVFALNGWEDSEGARKEMAIALFAGLGIILEPPTTRPQV